MFFFARKRAKKKLVFFWCFFGVFLVFFLCVFFWCFFGVFCVCVFFGVFWCFLGVFFCVFWVFFWCFLVFWGVLGGVFLCFGFFFGFIFRDEPSKAGKFRSALANLELCGRVCVYVLLIITMMMMVN